MCTDLADFIPVIDKAMLILWWMMTRSTTFLRRFDKNAHKESSLSNNHTRMSSEISLKDIEQIKNKEVGGVMWGALCDTDRVSFLYNALHLLALIYTKARPYRGKLEVHYYINKVRWYILKYSDHKCIQPCTNVCILTESIKIPRLKIDTCIQWRDKFNHTKTLTYSMTVEGKKETVHVMSFLNQAESFIKLHI